MGLARIKLPSLELLGLAGVRRSGDLRRSLGTLRESAREVTEDLRAALGPALEAARGAISSRLRSLGPARRQPGLELDLPEGTLRFRGLTEFEFALASKTGYPVARVAELLPRSPAELRKVATHIRRVEKRFAEVLTDSLREPGLISELMREVGIKLYSKDHGWRDLFESLNRCGPEHDEYKRLALVRYMQYLGSRQDVLRSIYLDKVRDGGLGALAELGSAPGRSAPGEPLQAEPLRAEPLRAGPMNTPAMHAETVHAETVHAGPAHPGSSHDTALFDPSAADDAGGLGERRRPLERGETVTVHIPRGEALELMLSEHPFELFGGPGHDLVDENGVRHRLRPGKNMVGRQVDGDVVVDPQLRAVSRRHLIIETIDDETVALTDVSAHGTSIIERLVRI